MKKKTQFNEIDSVILIPWIGSAIQNHYACIIHHLVEWGKKLNNFFLIGDFSTIE